MKQTIRNVAAAVRKVRQGNGKQESQFVSGDVAPGRVRVITSESSDEDGDEPETETQREGDR